MQMNRKFLFLYSLSIALFNSSNGIAAGTAEPEVQKFYDVEIIVFKNKSVPKGKELNFPTPSPSRTKQTLNLSNSANIRKNRKKGFVSLQQKELRLQDIVQQIEKSSRYDLLIHTGWRQPGLDKTKALPVWIKGGKIFGHGYSSIDQVDPQVDRPKNLKSSQPANALYELEGQIIITLSRYLHTRANLVLRKPANTQNVPESAENLSEGNTPETIEGYRLSNYGLNEQRRMRSKKLHYLDHPQFGMLVLITPYETPKVESVEETPAIPDEIPVATEKKPG